LLVCPPAGVVLPVNVCTAGWPQGNGDIGQGDNPTLSSSWRRLIPYKNLGAAPDIPKKRIIFARDPYQTKKKPWLLLQGDSIEVVMAYGFVG
jgi:hypothetical protein